MRYFLALMAISKMEQKTKLPYECCLKRYGQLRVGVSFEGSLYYSG